MIWTCCETPTRTLIRNTSAVFLKYTADLHTAAFCEYFSNIIIINNAGRLCLQSFALSFFPPSVLPSCPSARLSGCLLARRIRSGVTVGADGSVGPPALCVCACTRVCGHLSHLMPQMVMNLLGRLSSWSINDANVLKPLTG